MKKAQGISINVIIIAAIALLVLVVLSVIYIGRMGDWGAKTGDCQNKGGKCATACNQGDAVGYPTQYSAWTCPTQGQVCCIKAGP